MKWTGSGVLRSEKEVIYPGDTIPKNFLDEKRIEKFKKQGKIDGRLSREAYEKAQAQVDENKRKLLNGDSETDEAMDSRVFKQLKEEQKKLTKKLQKLNEDDPKVEEISNRLKEIEEALS